MIVAHVAGEVRFPKGQLSREQIERVRMVLQVKNPARESAERRQNPRAHFIPEHLDVATIDDDGALCVPRGAAGRVATAIGEPIEWVTWLAETPAPIVYNGKLHPYQAQARDTFVHSKGSGVIVVPCGGGKTEIGLACAATLQLRTLVIVPTKELLYQWRDRARLRGFTGEIGIVGDGKHSLGDLTIATYQSAAKMGAELARFGFAIVDECHHIPARTMFEILRNVPARRRLGLTATPHREDSLTPLVTWTIGRTLVTISQRDLEEVGAVVRPTWTYLDSSFTYPYQSSEDWAPCCDALAADRTRTEMIARCAVDLAADRMVLVLTGRKEHAHSLAAWCAQFREGGKLLPDRIFALTSDTGTRVRKDVIEQARAGGVDILIATQLADEGLDLPRLGAVILAWPGKAEGRIVQRIGRVLRPLPGKLRPIVVDIRDPLVGPMMGQARKRAATYRKVWGPEQRSLR